MPRLSAVPDRGHICVGRTAKGETLLVCTLSRTSVQLPFDGGVEWALSFDADGDAFVFPNRTPGDDREIEPLFASQLLGFSVYSDEKGAHYLVPAEPELGRPYPLADMLCRHNLGDVEITGGALQTVLKFEFGYFPDMLDGGHFMWSLPDVHKLLNKASTRSSTGTPGRWVQDMWPSWSKTLAMFGMGGALVRSKPKDAAMGDNKGAEGERRVLPFPSVSTGGLLALSGIWANCSRYEGGMADNNKQSAIDFWAILTEEAMKGDYVFNIHMDPGVACHWPAPSMGKGTVRLEVRKGEINLEGVRFPSELHEQAATWRSLVKGASSMQLKDLLQGLFRTRRSLGFLCKQVVWALAAGLERCMESAMNGEPVASNIAVNSASWHSESGYALSRKLGHYRNCCMQLVRQRGASYFSISTDKSRVHAMGMQNSAFVLPSGEVIPDYVAELDLAKAAPDPKQELDEVHRQRVQRQLAFMKRKKDTSSKDLQPRKRHRKSAFVWLNALENQVHRELWASQGSLLDYCVPKDPAQAPPAAEWGRLSIAPDQGGDGVSGYNFLARELNCCCDLTPDPSHGINNDIWQGFQDMGVKSQMLLWLITFNIPMGPYQSDARYQEVRSVLSEMFANCAPENTPLFVAMAPNMLREKEFRDLDDTENPLHELWHRLASESPWATKGSKLVKSRFMQFTRKAREEAAHLTARGFGYLLACMEMRFMSDKSLDKMPVLNLGGDTGAEGMGSTSSVLETIEEKAVRKSGANNIMLGAMQYNNEDSCKLLRMVLELAAPLEAWHGEQNKALRSASASLTWTLQQLCGGFFQCLRGIIRTTKAQRSLCAVPFTLPAVGRANPDPEMDMCYSFKEDHMAGLMADGALIFSCLRVQRQLWLLRGWPARMALVLKDDGICNLAVSCFQKDYNNFMKFSKNNENEGAQAIIDRSVFKLAAVVQDAQLLSERGWVADSSFKQHVESCNNRIISSQLIEDAFNRQKNAKKEPNRRGTAERSWGLLMEKEVLTQVHSYEEPRVSDRAALSSPLPDEVFRAKVTGAPPEFYKLPGFKQQAGWYSPGAGAHAVAYADLALLEFVQAHGLASKVKNLWLGGFFKMKHRLLVRHCHSGVFSKWFFAVRPISGTCSLVWPAVEHTVPGGHDRFYTPSDNVVCSDLLAPVLDHTAWQAMPFNWKSPLGQVASYPATAVDGWGEWSIKAFPSAQPAQLMQACCAQGFWDVPRTTLVRIAKYLELKFKDSGDELEVMEALIKGIMKKEGAEAMPFLEARAVKLAEADTTDRHDAEVLSTDDAQECLSNFDKQEYKKVMERKVKVKKDAGTFAEAMKERRAKHRAEAAAASAKPRGSSKSSGKKVPQKRIVIPKGALTQPEVKMMSPSGSYVWRNNSAQTWCGKMPPMGDLSRSWLAHGHRGSAILILRELWDRAVLVGAESECRVEGLYSDGAMREG